MFDAVVDGRSLRVEVRVSQKGYVVTLDGRALNVDFEQTGRDFASLLINGLSHEVGLEKRDSGYTVVLEDDVLPVELRDAARGGAAPVRRPGGGPLRLTAPMPGRLLRILVQVGQEVTAGQGLVVVEAMKMENELRSSRPGRVKELPVREGQAVETGALLVVVE